MSDTPVLAALHVYPVKSCGGVSVQEAFAGPRGLLVGQVLDRSWMVADLEQRLISQREEAALARVRVRLVPDTAGQPEAVELTVEGQSPLRLDPFVALDQRTDILVHGLPVPARQTRPAANAWFSSLLGRPVQLVYQGEAEQRAIAAGYSDAPSAAEVSFADGFQYLVGSASTLAALNQRLAEPIPMARFRPNLVVGGSPADAEYAWRRVAIGAARFALVKPCERCVMTTIDQERGVRTGKEPLASLAKSHFLDEAVPGGRIHGPIFGENAVPTQCGLLRVGDAIEVLEAGAVRAFRVRD